MNKKIIIGLAVAAVPAGLLLAAGQLYPTNVAETSRDHAESVLRTRRYKTDLQTFVAGTEKIIPELSSWGANWKLAGAETNENSALVKAEVPVVFFTDDLQVKAEPEAAGGDLIVNVHSKSRVGKSDFGENRRHVIQILEALDAKFGKQ